MCEINKDYISVVRNKGGLLHFERVPIIRSEKLTSQLMCMSCDDSYTLEEMDCVLKNDPLFSQIMIPYWDLQYLEDKSEIEPYNCLMLSALEGYECIKTKPELFKKAVEIIQLVDMTNKYVTDNAPWTLAKEEKMTDCGQVLTTVLEIMCVVSALIYPYCPNIAQRMASQLSFDLKGAKLDTLNCNNIKVGKLISKEDIKPVFLRMDSELADKSKK